MKTTTRILTLAFAVGVMPAMAACERDREMVDDLDVPPATEVTPEDAVRVTDVDLGRAVDADGRITDEDDTDEFGPDDTIYVSVDTEGTASGATLSARWLYEDGQIVDETSQTISPTGPSVTEFHISNPDGLAPGGYTVEILLNGETVETRDFEVK
jgi:hypothetical protein